MRARSVLNCSLLLLAAAAAAGEPGAGIFIGGFVSQGYLNTADNNYLMENTRDGSGEFNEAAIGCQTLPDNSLGIDVLKHCNEVITGAAYRLGFDG